MKLEYNLSLKQTQKLTMTPKMIQEIQILQYNVQELDSYINEQVLSNPVLEAEELGKKDNEQSMEDALGKKEASDEIIKHIKEKGYDDISYKQEYNKDQNKDSYQYYKVADITLCEHLKFQLQFASKGKDCRNIGEYVIETLDENGYMTSSCEEISQALKVPIDYIEKVLNLVRTFDPMGVGAKDLSQCLLLQLKGLGNKDENLERIVKDHLEDVANNRLQNIAKALAISVVEVQNLGDTIKTLDPKPGSQFGTQDQVKLIIPDIIIKKEKEDFVVELSNSTAPKLLVSSYYEKMLQESKKDKELETYLNERLSSALWLIKCIEQRQRTILNVATSIVDFQKDFFVKGTKYLKPLTLKKVADHVGVHESTVSRTINGKYVQHSTGIYELKYFFSSGVGTAYEGDVSSNSVKEQIKEMVEKEDPKKPLSDQKIVDILTKQGMDISRRTITKYRESMNIASSTKRRRY